MSECVVKITKPLVCITKDGYYGNCQMDRVWCIQRNAPKGITMGEAYAAMTDKVPSWCPILCQLPEGHGRLLDEKEVKDWVENWLCVNKYYHPYSSPKSIPVSELYDVLQRMDATAPADTEERMKTV